MRFLLIEDNAALAEAVVARRQLGGHVVDHAADLQAAGDFTATTAYDLILLDIMLPDGRDLQLRTRALRLFEVFVNAPGQIFSKSALVDRLFSYDEAVSENAIEVYVGPLRKHLDDADLAIRTVRGLVYKLEQT